MYPSLRGNCPVEGNYPSHVACHFLHIYSFILFLALWHQPPATSTFQMSMGPNSTYRESPLNIQPLHLPCSGGYWILRLSVNSLLHHSHHHEPKCKTEVAFDGGSAFSTHFSLISSPACTLDSNRHSQHCHECSRKLYRYLLLRTSFYHPSYLIGHHVRPNKLDVMSTVGKVYQTTIR